MNKLVGFRRLKSMVHPSFPISVKYEIPRLEPKPPSRTPTNSAVESLRHPGTGVEPLPHLHILKEILCCHRSTHHADLP
jgi:hypothetical protein